MSSTISEILSPRMQEAFWGALDPDMRAFLTAFEQKEQWTYKFEELPDLFLGVAKALPSVVELPLTAQTRTLLRDLIPLLVAMPLRQAIAAIVWLDHRASVQPEMLGWGVICFREASSIKLIGPSDPLFAEARMLHERIHVLMQSRIATSLFNKLKQEIN